MQYLEDVPDGVKITASLAAPGLSYMGISVEEWTYIFSAIVSIMFIIEKAPVVFRRIKEFIKWIRSFRE
jgi:hypothetical protein